MPGPRRGLSAAALALLVLLALLAGLTGCAGLPGPGPVRGPEPGSPAWRQALLGVWCSPDGQGGCWAHDEFSADGGFQACGRQPDEARPFHGRGRFELQGQRMCYTVEAATPNFWVPVGARWCSEILAIDAQRQRWRDIDTGAVADLRRVRLAGPACPPGP